MKAATRPAFLRLLMIANEMRLATHPRTTVQLASHHACSSKTIYRDLEFLRDIGCPIFFDAHTNRWTWNRMVALPWWIGGSNGNAKPPANIVRGANYSADLDQLRSGFVGLPGINLHDREQEHAATVARELKRRKQNAVNNKRYRAAFTDRGLTCEGKPRVNRQHPELRGLYKQTKRYHRLYRKIQRREIYA